MPNMTAMPNSTDDEITTREALKLLGYSDPSWVSKRVKSGALVPSRKLPGKRGAYLFRRADVEAFAARSRTTAS